MSSETKRGRRDSVGVSRPTAAQPSAPRRAGSPGCILMPTVAEPRQVPAAGTEDLVTTAKALARWENEGGRVLAAGQRLN